MFHDKTARASASLNAVRDLIDDMESPLLRAEDFCGVLETLIEPIAYDCNQVRVVAMEVIDQVEKVAELYRALLRAAPAELGRVVIAPAEAGS